MGLSERGIDIKIALVVQGPIISYGLSGNTVGHGKTRVDESRFVAHSCETDILKTLESALSLFDEVVLSTWEEQNTEFLSALQPKIRIIKSKDPGTLIPNYRKQIKDKPFVNEINTLRQFTSTLNGLLSLNDVDISYAIKIRTDQLLDLKLLKEALFKLIESNRTYLTPYFSKTTPFAIPDFFLAGKLSELISLCRLMQSRSLILQ
jgi:hypothetical protein